MKNNPIAPVFILLIISTIVLSGLNVPILVIFGIGLIIYGLCIKNKKFVYKSAKFYKSVPIFSQYIKSNYDSKSAICIGAGILLILLNFITP